jgi:uncharacterized protein (TIGR02391 family)
MPRVFSADALLNGTVDVTTPVFLDTTSWKAFTAWSQQNLKALQTMLGQGLVIWIFPHELSYTEPKLYSLYLKDQEIDEEDSEVANKGNDDEDVDEIEPIISFEQRLESDLGIRFHPETLPNADISYRTFLYEIREIYFHDVSNHERRDRHEEFVFLTRRAARNDDILRVLTAQPAFQRLVNAEVFLIPTSPYKPMLPANFDVFTELGIHPMIRQVVEADFRNGDYPKVVFQATNAFRDFVRQITGLTSDGGALMNEALMLQYNDRVRGKPITHLPHLLLNNISLGDLESDSYVGEQDGFARFALGVFKAIRNPNAHATATDPFIQQRFNDQIMAVKVLCFLSMLCERIEKPPRFSP